MKIEIDYKYAPGDTVTLIKYPYKIHDRPGDNIAYYKQEDKYPKDYVIDETGWFVDRAGTVTPWYRLHAYCDCNLRYFNAIKEEYIIGSGEVHPFHYETDIVDVFGVPINLGDTVYSLVYRDNRGTITAIADESAYVGRVVMIDSDSAVYIDNVKYLRDEKYGKIYSSRGPTPTPASCLIHEIPDTFMDDLKKSKRIYHREKGFINVVSKILGVNELTAFQKIREATPTNRKLIHVSID